MAKLDNKKIGVIFLLVAAVVGVALLFVFLSRGKKDEEPERPKVNISQDMPQADLEEMPTSKMDAYRDKRRSNIEDYFESIGGEPDDLVDEDPADELAGNDKPRKGSGPKEVTYEELFGSSASGGQQTAADIQARREERDRKNAEMIASMHRQQMQDFQTVVDKQNAQKEEEERRKRAEEEPAAPVAPAVPEREKIDVERVKVVKSGGISSMDDEFGGISSSGVSSLDGEDREFAADEAYPFKCMFVRQEKLKGGQRVSVRLLEDIVVEGQLVRKNTHLNAVCTIGDRVDLKVSNIDINGRIINLDFDAYDNDGTRGIYAPDLDSGTMVEDALKQAGLSAGRRRMSTAVGQTVQDLLSAGSMVITGKGKDRTVTIPAGYQFYLVKHSNKR